jgi:PAS domain S-box-containing protein
MEWRHDNAPAASDLPAGGSQLMDEAQLRGLLHEQAPDAVIFAGTDGVIQAWNDAATALFGYSVEEAMGQSLDLIIPERFRDAHWKGFDRALAVGDTKYRGQALPTRSQTKDGATIYVELTFAIIKDASGTVIGALAHARDITERFLKEREQRQQAQQAQQ